MAVRSVNLVPLRQTAVLLVGHGTRSELGRQQCRALAGQIAAALDTRNYAAELAFLELATPTIDEAVARLGSKDIERLIVAPLLLFAAAHAQDDIPSAVTKALAARGKGELPVSQTEPLSLQEPVMELAAQRFREATDPHFGAEETCLLLVGRGSRNAEATAQMQRLGKLLHQRLGIGQTEVGFLAMAQPAAREIIAAAAASRFRHIVIQPHLLFQGELLHRLHADLAAAAAKSPHQTWRMSRVLGEDLEHPSAIGHAATPISPLARIIQQAIESAGNK